MKILQVNCVYEKGSTGKIVSDIHSVLINRGHSSIVCYGRGRKDKNNDVYKFCSELESKIHNIAHRYLGALAYGGCFYSTMRLIQIIKKEKPDIVHLHCINGFCVNIFELLEWLGENRIKTVLSNHAEFFYTGNCGHAYDCEKWKQEPGCGTCPILYEATAGSRIDYTRKSWIKMKKAFAHFHSNDLICTAVSPWVRERFLQSPITNKFHCLVVYNGLNTTIFNGEVRKRKETVRKSLGISPSEKVVFHATAFFNLDESSLKGGRFVYQLAQQMPEVTFVVAALSYQKILDCPSNLKLIGSVVDQKKLAELYAISDLCLVTSKRETFSMITAESLCCGTPVVGFKAGGPESIALKDYSQFVDYGDIVELQLTIRRWLERNDINSNEISILAKDIYSKEKMTMGYIDCYHKLLNC